MKKSFCFTIVLCCVLMVLLGGCSKKHCYEPLYENPPVLSDTGYNTCEAVVYNFRTYSGEGAERLQMLDHKDTIKVCGYITMCTNKRAIDCSYSLVDNPIVSDNQLDMEIPLCCWALPDSVDVSSKCYMTGLIAFDIYRKKIDAMSPCDIIFPKIFPIEYHFE